MYCPNCGTQIPEDASFCPNCGMKINQTSASPAEDKAIQSVKTMVPEKKKKLWRWTIVIVAVILVAAIVGGILSASAHKLQLVNTKYSDGTVTQQYNKSTKTLTVKGGNRTSAYINLVDSKTFVKSDVLPILLLTPEAGYSIGFNPGLTGRFSLALFAYSPWILNGKIQNLNIDDDEYQNSANFYVQNKQLQSATITFNDDGDVDTYQANYTYDDHGNLASYSLIDDDDEDFSEEVIIERSNGQNVTHISYYEDGDDSIDFTPKYDSAGNVVHVNTNYDETSADYKYSDGKLVSFQTATYSNSPDTNAFSYSGKILTVWKHTPADSSEKGFSITWQKQ